MITLITTKGNTSLDKYSQELSKRLTVDEIETKMPVSFKDGYNFLKQLRSCNAGIFHLPHQQFARYSKFISKPCVITVHDLSLQCSSLYNLNSRMKIYMKFDILGIKNAKHIIAISKYTKNDLISKLKISPDKISIVFQGVDHNIFLPQETPIFDFQYILYVGSEQPRKNLSSLLKAFQIIKLDTHFKDLKLIKIGSPGLEADRKSTLKMIDKLNLQNDVIFPGFVPEAELPKYYSKAACFVLPSLYEGFGLPILEAMACGCPVIASNVTSIPEVVDDAGLLADPLNVKEIVNAIEQVLSDDGLREKLIDKGFAQSRKFSWDKTAFETAKVYESLQ